MRRSDGLPQAVASTYDPAGCSTLAITSGTRSPSHRLPPTWRSPSTRKESAWPRASGKAPTSNGAVASPKCTRAASVVLDGNDDTGEGDAWPDTSPGDASTETWLTRE